MNAPLEVLTPEDFTPANTRHVLAEACHQAQLDAVEALVLRHQTAAVYLLARQGIVIKIGRPDEGSLAAVRRTLALTSWLAASKLPVVAPAEIGQPAEIAGCPVTFWRYLPQPPDREINGQHLGALLRQLHELPQPPIALPPLDAMTAIRRSLQASRILGGDERDFLTHRADQLFRRLRHVQYQLPSGLIHGDPQHRNALWDGDVPVLADLDSAATGPREWDLVTVEIHCRRFGYPHQEYEAFADAYGLDIRTWSGYPLLRDLRELRMITTNARKSPPGSPAAMEVHKRVSALRGGWEEAMWSIL